jgi:conjugative transfer signal peptidase TraF
LKHTFKHKIALFYVLVTALSLATLALCFLHSLGYRVNLSGSMPGYLYRATSLKDGEAIYRGDIVVIDISRVDNPLIEIGIQRGYVRLGQKMLKEIGAIPGDIVELMGDTLSVNGHPTPMTVLSSDSRGRALSPYPTPVVMPQDFYWLVSIPHGGFDSRYFGPVHRSVFTHKARPVF